MYKISVIIPVFNVEDYLEDSFNSILNQTFGFENLEVIYVDDHSTDGSQQIIQSFVDKYDNVNAIFLEKNSGYAGKPRNVGIEFATSDYIMFLDPDDTFLDNACEFLYNEITSDDFNFVSANFLKYVNGEYVLFDWKYYFPGIKPNDRVYLNNVRENMDIFKVSASVFTKIFKRNFLIDNKIKFPVGIAAQDLVFIVECLIKTEKVLYINEPVVKYRIRESGSISSKLTKNVLSSYIDTYKLFLDLIYDFDKNYCWLASRSLSTFWFNNFKESSLPDIDKVDLLKYAEPLWDYFEPSKLNLNYKKSIFFNYCLEKKYFEAVQILKKIYYDKNNYSKKDVLENTQIYFLSDNLDEIIKFNRIFDNIKFITLDETNLPSNIVYININEYYDNIIEDSGKIIVNKENSSLNLKFNNFNQFYEYFINEITLKDNSCFINSTSFNPNIDLAKIKILTSTEFDKKEVSRYNAVVSDNKNYLVGFKNNYLIDDLFSSIQWEEILFEVLTKEDFNKNYQIIKTKFDFKKLKKENKKLKNENRNVNKYYQELLNSNSWKITKPIRKLKEFLKKLKNH